MVFVYMLYTRFFFFKQKTAYEMRIMDWSSDVCSSDLVAQRQRRGHWDTTPANAWGAVTVRRFAELYPASAITGVTNIGLAGATASQSWPLPAEPVSPPPVALAAATMRLHHHGPGPPGAAASAQPAGP